VPVIGDVVIKVTAGDGNSSTREISGGQRAVRHRVSCAAPGPASTSTAGCRSAWPARTSPRCPTPTTRSGRRPGIGWWGIDATAGDIFNAKGYLYDAEIGGPMTLPGPADQRHPEGGGGTECWSTIGDAVPVPH
jgi:hypothetical protein